MPFEEILYEREDRVATITLHRPEVLNAQTAQMTTELRQALRLAGRDDRVRAVIVTGAGRAFCAGSDLSRGARSAPPSEDPPPRGAQSSITLELFDFPKPVIAAINGAAVGFGVSSTLAMDIRISSTAGRFGFVYSQRGLSPESGSSWFLPRVVGLEQALRWLYSGRVFDADEALAGGLVSEVVDPEDLLPRAHEIAQQIASETSAVSTAVIRRLVWQGLGASDPEHTVRLESAMTSITRASDDGREGVRSFLEQRPAAFTGRVSTDLPDPEPGLWGPWSPRSDGGERNGASR